MTRRDTLPFLLGFGLCGVLWLATSAPAHASGAYIERWVTRGSWTDLGQSCATVSQGTAHMTCQSAALASTFTLAPSEPMHVDGMVRAQAATGSTTPYYFGAIGLVEDDPSGKYLDVATFNGVPPFSPLWGPSLGACCQLVQGGHRFADGILGQWYSFAIDYTPGTVTYSVDGIPRGSAPWTIQQAPRIWLLCVSVGEGVPNDGSAAACDFGPLTVTGGVRPLCIPSFVRRCP